MLDNIAQLDFESLDSLDHEIDAFVTRIADDCNAALIEYSSRFVAQRNAERESLS